MRLNFAAHTFLLAVLGVSCIFLLHLEQNIFAQQSPGPSQPERNRAPALQTNFEGSLSTPASLGNLRFTHLSVADGLSHSDVRAIVQDRQGFMWFGTWLGGLNRYDGYTFKVYKHSDHDDRSLGCDSIWGLYVDRSGVLWVGTNEGVDRYDRNTDSFVHYRHRPDDPTSLPGYQATAFGEDKSGSLWVTTSGGLARFDRTSSRFIAHTPAASAPTRFDTDMRALCPDATGLLWLSTWGAGVSVLDTSTGHSIQYKNDPKDPVSLSSDDVSHIFQDRAGAVWVSTQHGLNRFDPKTHKFTRYLHDPANPASLTDDYVQATFEDREGRFWVATNNGLNVMDRERGTFSRYLHDPNDPSSLSSNVINKRALYADASGALWIGMRSTGVDRVPGVAARFTTYRHTSEGAKTPSNNVITALAIGTAGTLWIGTEAGLDRFDGQTFTHYLANPDDLGSLGPGPQRLVVEDTHGAVWTGTYGGGLDRLNGRGVKHFRHDAGNSNSPGNDNIAGLVADPVGGLWIGVYGAGLDHFDGRHFIHFLPSPGDPAGLPDAYVHPVLLDSRGMLWLGSVHSGLVRLDTKTRKFTSYLLDVNRPGSPAVNWTEDIYSDGASIWVASPTGLFRFDIGTEKFTRHYTEKDGLPSNKVLGVLGDTLENLWVSTDNGLSKFDPRSQTFRNYDMFDGLQDNGFSARCRARAPDGRLFFGGVNGLSAFYPDKLLDNQTAPPVVLTDFELFNKPVTVGGKESPLQQAIHVASSIVLRHDQSVIRFQFAALNYDSPQKNQYAYKLEGFDQDWQHTDAGRRFATYTNLDPGHYTFRVKASNNDGVWNEQGVALHLTILPPWWKTNWFRALCAMAFFGLLWAAYQFRVRQLRDEFEMTLEARVGERTRIARELHDTLLQSFHGLLLQLQTVSLLLRDRPMEAREKLDSTIEQAAQAITEGRDAVQGLRESAAQNNDLAQAISTLGEELAADPNNPRPEFRVAVEGKARDLHPIVRDEMYKIATEALRNAFRHAHARCIEVELRYDSEQLRLRVRDDGKGMDPALLAGQGREGHYGLRGMRERTKLIGGKLTVWSEVEAGTELELCVPASKAYARAPRHSWFSQKS
jgi:ligand-binding sensor domain-containing protein/signal transduction histidine kinase